jgi:AcrR family transcriptional regulator
MTTKEKIIYEALTLFSTQGYEAVSVRDISHKVGIKESSLYNHFKNKQDIFDTILKVCEERAMNIYGSLSLTDTFKGDVSIYQNISEGMLLEFTTTLFKFYVSDDYMSKFRHLLTIEQYINEQIGSLYRDMFIDQAINFQSMLFSKLMEDGFMIRSNPQAVAMEFYAPIFMMLYRYETYNEEVEKLLKEHIQNFSLKNTPMTKSEKDCSMK